MKDSIKKILLAVIVIAAIVVVFLVFTADKTENFRHKYEGYDLSTDVAGVNREGTYASYLNKNADAAYPQKDIAIDLQKYTEGTDVKAYADYKGALYTGDYGKVTWEVNVPEAGFYNLYMEYLTVDSRGVEIERALYINGEIPFTDAALLTFTRLWTDAAAPKVDNQGNEIRPQQIEVYDWQSAYFKDEMGYTIDPYTFYFKKGTNTVTLETVNEPMVIRALELRGVEEIPSYEEYIASTPKVTMSEEGLKYYNKIQGEDAKLRSESSLYAKYDKASATTEPYSVTKTILNYTGGEVWTKAGQWIQWDFEVPEDGYYNIAVKARQNYSRGSVSCRNLYIDGEVPFKEAQTISFSYGSDWKTLTLADDEGEAYDFYLTKGSHTIRLEAALGNMGVILGELEDSTFRLNQMYRTILVYTGASPDANRDYNIHQVYPDVVEAMGLESKRLYKLVDDVVLYTGQKADKIATAQTLARQLEKFVDKPHKISTQFVSFKDNITALGTSILNMSETKLDVDYLVVCGTEKKVEKDSVGFFGKIWHEIKSFFASFVVDYDAVGDVYVDSEEVVKVWIATGRDQGTILKAMVDDTFTPESGIGVNVEIVDGGTLLNAVIAGKGPDVVLSIGADQPVNYALRNAAEDLTQFEGWEEVFSAYYPSAYTAYQYNGGIYGLPETHNYNVMFYREDIMKDLELEIPQTWDDVIALLPTIQGNNLEVGLPTTASTTAPDLSAFYTFLYQMGGDVYDEEGKKTTINQEEGVKAFDLYTSFFNDYGLPKEYDFISRFRSGQMPIAIVSYTMFNTLVVSAPEIKGLWDFTLVPGTVRTDENGEEYIDRSIYSTGTCSMMIRNKNEVTKKNAWEFMKWWASADTQVRFGHELEALLGSSARYATANREAFTQLAWSAENVKVLEEQWSWTVGFREVAGGYYTGRHITNAIRKVMNEKEDARETILEYAITIDEELEKKRKEFGLPID